MKVIEEMIDVAFWFALAAIVVVGLLYYGKVSQETALVQGKSNAVVACFEYADTRPEVDACSALKTGLGF